MCTLTFGGDMDMGGNPLAVTVTIKASNDLVWKATGQRIAGPNFPQQATAPAGTVTTGIAMPATDQTGFADGNGNDILGWDYVVTVEYSNSLGRETVTKNWQPLSGQGFTDFDMIPSGPATPGFTAPTGVVTSVNGQTGAVTVAASGNDTAAVHYTADSPTSAQQTRARTNLGLAAVAATGNYADLTGIPPSSVPWEFRPEDYGAKGDGQCAHDAATNGTNTFTSASMAGKCAVGQWVMINGGRGTNDYPAIGTITAISGSSVTLDTTARGLPINATATGLDVLWGTDDTAPINACLAAGKTYAETHDYNFTCAFQDRIYVVGGNTQSNDGNIMYNCSIRIPRPTGNNGRKLAVTFQGASRASHFNYWDATTPAIVGTVIASTLGAPDSLDPTYSVQSVFGAGTPIGGDMAPYPGDFNPVFVNHAPSFRNITVLCSVYTNVTAFDTRWSSGCHFDGSSATVFAPSLHGTGVTLISLAQSSLFAGKQGCGFRLPLFGNNADITIPDLTVVGYSTALWASPDHTYIGNLKAIYTPLVLGITAGGGGHGLVIDMVNAEAYQYGIQNSANNTTGTIIGVRIGLWSTEFSANPLSGGGFDINDPQNTLVGEINWTDPVEPAHQFPVVNGGGNCRIVCYSVARGTQTAPTVPASTVAKQNPFWRDAVVRITGGTVTVISVDGQTVATATNSTVTVPTGKSITLTYSSAPTWTWSLL